MPTVKKPLLRALAKLYWARRWCRGSQELEALFALRTTAQQADNSLSEWMTDTVGSFARYKILMALWITKGKAVPHKDIVAAMGVTRATVSGLVAALEREGFVKSYVHRDECRKIDRSIDRKG